MDYVDTNWYILDEISRFAQAGTELDLNDIAQYLIFQDIVQLKIKWDIWNKKDIAVGRPLVGNSVNEVLTDITYLIEQMRNTLTNLVRSKMG